MKKVNILIVEDEIKIAAVLADYFKNNNFNVFILHRGDRVLSLMHEQDLDFILLDIMLPGMDGTKVCREIRKFSSIPIIMLTAMVEEIDVLKGLKLGADDYICKPFSPREVVARVEAVLRRTRNNILIRNIEIGPFSLNTGSREVKINEALLKITPNEYGILTIMMASANRVFSRSELVSRVQGYRFDGYNRTIDTHIKNLRKKIAVHLPKKEVIHSVYGAGYKFSLEY